MIRYYPSSLKAFESQSGRPMEKELLSTTSLVDHSAGLVMFAFLPLRCHHCGGVQKVRGERQGPNESEQVLFHFSDGVSIYYNFDSPPSPFSPP